MDGSGRLFGPFMGALPSWIDAHPVAYPADAFRYDGLEATVTRAVADRRPELLIAESCSGPIALRVVAGGGTSVRALILVASFFANPHPRLSPLAGLLGVAFRAPAPPRAILRRLLLSRDAPVSLVDALRRAISEVPAATMAGRLREIVSVDVRRPMIECPVPAFVVEASEDRMLPSGLLSEARRLNPRAQGIVITGPHLLLRCRPREVAEALTPFLAEVLALRGRLSHGKTRSTLHTPNLTGVSTAPSAPGSVIARP